ncbi:MAG: Stp1/IreP family PP2C-type Ser/Thr phosphatase, partial [Thermoanaerobacteraceae bacterium]|nr:Stp1/IreP family PP2C-type Ser/Thr phosphatase [Thermoanaerobacteraceae bacterium]
NNEDAFYFPEKDSNFPELYIVADGMGGHQGGEIASEIAVNEVASYINSNLSKDCDAQKVKGILESSIITANNKILSLASEHSRYSGMGTTITIALFHNGYLYIGHVGDSRAYRIRDDNIEQLTRDHSLVWQLAEEGRITMEEAKNHPMKNVITKALGTDENIEPDILEFDLKDNDIIILCSDGLTNMLDNDSIKSIVCSLEPEEAAFKLIEKANSKGGLDNITVGIIKADKVGM